MKDGLKIKICLLLIINIFDHNGTYDGMTTFNKNI